MRPRARMAAAGAGAVALLLAGAGAVALAADEAPVRSGAPARTAVTEPFVLGVNLGTPAQWAMERSFANLAAAGTWFSRREGRGWEEMPPERINAHGSLTGLQPGEGGALTLAIPLRTRTRAVRVNCRWDGVARFNMNDVSDLEQGRGALRFTWGVSKTPSLLLEEMDPRDPIRNLDCREADVPADAAFDQAFLASLKPFRIVRFLDWQRTNENLGGRWERRTQPGSIVQLRPDGVAIERMVALANAGGVDPWFMMPWSADDAYVEQFARLVHARLAPGRRVYLEHSNEVWNTRFPAARLAAEEGSAARLSDDPNQARLRRHAIRARGRGDLVAGLRRRPQAAGPRDRVAACLAGLVGGAPRLSRHRARLRCVLDRSLLRPRPVRGEDRPEEPRRGIRRTRSRA